MFGSLESSGANCRGTQILLVSILLDVKVPKKRRGMKEETILTLDGICLSSGEEGDTCSVRSAHGAILERWIE